MNSRRISIASAPLLFVVLFFALGYVLFPLFNLLVQSLTADAYRVLFRRSLLEAAFNSVAISIVTVLGSAAVGIFFAYVFTFFDFPAKSFFLKIVLVPLALPPLIGVISFLFLVGESGMLSRLLSLVSGLSPSFFTVNGWVGIVLVHVYSFYVYFYLFVSSAFGQLDGNVLDASASLGASRARTMFRVLVPMLRPSLVGASLMTFMASMASFSAPFLFGGSTRFLTLEIYTAKLNGDDASAAAIAILLSIISVCVLVLLRWWQERNKFIVSTKGAARVSHIAHGRITRVIVVAAMCMLVFLFALPVVTIVALSFVKEGSWTFQIFPSSFTFMNYLHLFEEPHLFDPFTNSLEMALVATAAVIILGTAASYLVQRKNFHGKRLLEIALSLPFGIPGTVIAVGLIVSFNRPTLFSFGSILVGTFWILPLSYAVRNLPLLFRSATAGLESISPSLHEAADTLGSSNARTFRKIIVPMIMPAIASGALLVFINSVGEFVSSILLYSYGTRPISVEILSELRLFNIGGAAVCSTLLMVLVMAAVAVSGKYFRSSFTS